MAGCPGKARGAAIYDHAGGSPPPKELKMNRSIFGAFIFALACGPGAHAQIKIGIGGPVTGPDATFGGQLRMGVEQAVEDINASGGILGQQLLISAGDDAADPKQGVSVANKFVGDEVSVVVGHFNSGVTMPASVVYAENNILNITPASTNPLITERGLDTVFRTCGRDDQQGLVAARFLAAQKGKTIAIIHDKSTYGKGLADETRKSLDALGIKAVLYEGLNKGEKDFIRRSSRRSRLREPASSFGEASIPRRDCSSGRCAIKASTPC
jgi:branched-chain amino acid transport system substrate-binding protein